MTEQIDERKKSSTRNLGCFSIIGLMLLTVLLSVGVTIWIINYYLNPKPFEPVQLSVKEERHLNHKLDRFSMFADGRKPDRKYQAPDRLEPEPYSEVGASREIFLTERELNALLAKNTDLADKLVIDLSDNLASAKLLVPMEEEFPILGGKTVKVTAGLELAYDNERPIVVLKGISIMGVPIPNAWLGGIKNVDLVEEFGESEGFWQAFADGVDDIRVEEKRLKIRLKE